MPPPTTDAPAADRLVSGLLLRVARQAALLHAAPMNARVVR